VCIMNNRMDIPDPDQDLSRHGYIACDPDTPYEDRFRSICRLALAMIDDGAAALCVLRAFGQEVVMLEAVYRMLVVIKNRKSMEQAICDALYFSKLQHEIGAIPEEHVLTPGKAAWFVRLLPRLNFKKRRK